MRYFTHLKVNLHMVHTHVMFCCLYLAALDVVIHGTMNLSEESSLQRFDKFHWLIFSRHVDMKGNVDMKGHPSYDTSAENQPMEPNNIYSHGRFIQKGFFSRVLILLTDSGLI